MPQFPHLHHGADKSPIWPGSLEASGCQEARRNLRAGGGGGRPAEQQGGVSQARCPKQTRRCQPRGPEGLSPPCEPGMRRGSAAPAVGEGGMPWAGICLPSTWEPRASLFLGGPWLQPMPTRALTPTCPGHPAPAADGPRSFLPASFGLHGGSRSPEWPGSTPARHEEARLGSAQLQGLTGPPPPLGQAEGCESRSGSWGWGHPRHRPKAEVPSEKAPGSFQSSQPLCYRLHPYFSAPLPTAGCS